MLALPAWERSNSRVPEILWSRLLLLELLPKTYNSLLTCSSTVSHYCSCQWAVKNVMVYSDMAKRRLLEVCTAQRDWVLAQHGTFSHLQKDSGEECKFCRTFCFQSIPWQSSSVRVISCHFSWHGLSAQQNAKIFMQNYNSGHFLGFCKNISRKNFTAMR